MNGKIVNYRLAPANEHDLPAGTELNVDWEKYGAPKMIGDKAYLGGSVITPPKSNAKNPDPRWKEEYFSARKIIESAFSSLIGRGIRFGQVKTWLSLRLKVALVILSYNMRFISFQIPSINP